MSSFEGWWLVVWIVGTAAIVINTAAWNWIAMRRNHSDHGNIERRVTHLEAMLTELHDRLMPRKSHVSSDKTASSDTRESEASDS